MTFELPDGTPLELEPGATGADAARSIGEGLARAALAVKVDGELRDLAAPLPESGGEIEIVTARSGEDALWLVRHDAAHVLATAVMELYPGVKISIGPPIENGFYYDFEFPDGVTVSDADFEAIEAKMREHIKADEPFERTDVPVGEALERFTREGQDYKVELIQDLVRDQGVETVSLYRNGPFTDLCRGPHAPATKRIKAFKLTSLAGAYWRGDASRQQLTRVYGTAFLSKEELEAHLERLEQARAARPPQAGQGAWPVHVQRAVARLAVLAAQRRADLEPAHRLLAARERGDASTRRCARRSSTTSSCGSSPGTGTSTATTCTSPTSRTARWASSP